MRALPRSSTLRLKRTCTPPRRRCRVPLPAISLDGCSTPSFARRSLRQPETLDQARLHDLSEREVPPQDSSKRVEKRDLQLREPPGGAEGRERQPQPERADRQSRE